MFAILMAEKMSETGVKIIKNEVGCRDDTVPKTVETRRHCEEDCCMLSILPAVPSCFNSFWHGVLPTSYFIFNDFYTCII